MHIARLKNTAKEQANVYISIVQIVYMYVEGMKNKSCLPTY